MRYDGLKHVLLVGLSMCGLCVAGLPAVAQAQVSSAGRAFEKVSLDASQRNNYDVLGLGRPASAPSGDEVVYPIQGAAPGVHAGLLFSHYIASRSTSGWSSRLVTPPAEARDPNQLPDVVDFSPDLSAFITKSFSPLAPGAFPNTVNFFLSRAGQDVVTVTPTMPAGTASFAEFPRLARSTSSFSHVTYDSVVPLVKGVPDGFPFPYEWTTDGTVRLVGILPDPDGPGPLTGSLPPNGALTGGASLDHAVSADGNRIVFHAVEDLDVGGSSTVGQLYIRESGASTVHVTKSQRTDCAGDPTCGGDDIPNPAPDPAGTKPAFFWNAEAQHGKTVLFQSCEQLTDDSTAVAGPDGACRSTDDSTGHIILTGSDDLYTFDADTGALTDITGGVPGGGKVFGVVGAGESLADIYFVAGSILADGATPDAPNLYHWDRGKIHFVATLADTSSTLTTVGSVIDANSWAPVNSERVRTGRVSEDGRTVLFASRANITGYQGLSSACATGVCAQAYVYRADTSTVKCVSCPPGDVVPKGDVDLYSGSIARATDPLPHNLAAAGTRAYFETPDSLVPQDSNGKVDVYEWDGKATRLISSGTGAEDSRFVDASVSGDDVFFRTRSRLLSSDRDAFVDLYDARVGGGFPETPVPPKCLGSDECRAASTGRPGLVDPGTTLPERDLTAKTPPRGKFSPKRLTSKQRQVLARGGTVALRVKVNRAGVLTAIGVATVRGKQPTVLRASKRVGKAGTARLKLRLSKPARGLLAAKRRLAVDVSVRFSHALSVREQRVILTVATGA